MREIKAVPYTDIELGYAEENLATRVIFDLTPFIELFGDGEATIHLRRSGSEPPYPANIYRDGATLYWEVLSVDTAVPGYGECEVRWVIGEVLAKSETWRFRVRKSVTGEEKPATVKQDWYDNMLVYVDGVAGKAAKIEVSTTEPTDETVSVWVDPSGDADAEAVVMPDDVREIVEEYMTENPTSETWETIIDYTVPEDCAQVLLKTDLNGNAFKLKRAIVTFVLLPITGVTSSAALRYTVDGTVSNVYDAAHYAYGATGGPSAAGQCRVQRFEVLDTPSGVWLTALTNSNADSDYLADGYIGSRMIQNSVYEPMHSQTLMSKVTEISAAGVGSYTTAVGAGTRIKMVGVRA